VGGAVLKDTVIYCAAEKFGLDELKRLALRKQGLQSGIEVATILRSMRYAYDNTPDTDSKLRAHYLALIIRSRKTFKRSGTMQMEMEMGGRMFFDLFVAMCNHMDGIVDITQVPCLLCPVRRYFVRNRTIPAYCCPPTVTVDLPRLSKLIVRRGIGSARNSEIQIGWETNNRMCRNQFVYIEPSRNGSWSGSPLVLVLNIGIIMLIAQISTHSF
jgi:hypothetical protein